MKMNNVMLGVGAAMAVGSVATMAGSMMTGSSTKKMYKKKANKAMKSMGNMMDDLQYMFK
ncbi:MAG: hypothetical protein R3Y27_00210 [Clostridia bacterium]